MVPLWTYTVWALHAHGVNTNILMPAFFRIYVGRFLCLGEAIRAFVWRCLLPYPLNSANRRTSDRYIEVILAVKHLCIWLLSIQSSDGLCIQQSDTWIFFSSTCEKTMTRPLCVGWVKLLVLSMQYSRVMYLNSPVRWYYYNKSYCLMKYSDVVKVNV